MKPLIYILPSLVAGVLLQALFGGFRPSVLAFPLNAAVILALMATLWVVEGEWGEKMAVRTFRSVPMAVYYTHLPAQETRYDLVCRLML